MIDTYISNVNYTIFLYRNTSKSKYKNRLWKADWLTSSLGSSSSSLGSGCRPLAARLSALSFRCLRWSPSLLLSDELFLRPLDCVASSWGRDLSKFGLYFSSSVLIISGSNTSRWGLRLLTASMLPQLCVSINFISKFDFKKRINGHSAYFLNVD